MAVMWAYILNDDGAVAKTAALFRFEVTNCNFNPTKKAVALATALSSKLCAYITATRITSSQPP